MYHEIDENGSGFLLFVTKKERVRIDSLPNKVKNATVIRYNEYNDRSKITHFL